LQFTEAKLGRIFIIRLHDNDHLPDVLENFSEQRCISSALCFFIGGAKEISQVVVGPKNGEALPVEPVVALLGGVSEVCGIGTIFQNEEGKPKLHMHAGFGRGEKTILGCVRLGVDVWRIGEVIILELTEAAARRAVNQETKFEFLEIEPATSQIK
jgi:predicted DNA-binding protein with PD1-like motif